LSHQRDFGLSYLPGGSFSGQVSSQLLNACAGLSQVGPALAWVMTLGHRLGWPGSLV
jgi:hypothetical protein